MAVAKPTVFLVALLLLGWRPAQASLQCNMALGSCLTAFGASSLANLLDSSNCAPVRTLHRCVKTAVDSGTCSSSDVHSNGALVSALAGNPQCNAAALLKTSLLSIVIAALIGLLVAL